MLDVTTYLLSRRYADVAVKIAEKESNPELVVTDISGEFSPEGLSIIKDKKNALIILENRLFRLTRIEDKNYKYLCTATTGDSTIPSMIELDVNTETGYFSTRQLTIEGSSVEYLEERLNAHINDKTVHITNKERNFWNNKVSAEAIISDYEHDYRLNLKKD